MRVNNISLNNSKPQNIKSFGNLNYNPGYLEKMKKAVYKGLPELEKLFTNTFNYVEKIQSGNELCNLNFCTALNLNTGNVHPAIIEDSFGGQITHFYLNSEDPKTFIRLFEMANDFAKGFTNPGACYVKPRLIDSNMNSYRMNLIG